MIERRDLNDFGPSAGCWVLSLNPSPVFACTGIRQSNGVSVDRECKYHLLSFKYWCKNIRTNSSAIVRRVVVMLRICHPHDYKGLLQYEQSSISFSGPAGVLVNEVIDAMVSGLRSQMKNVTYVIQKSETLDVPARNSDNFLGCIDALQSNQSDSMLALVKYPINLPNISEGMILYEAGLMIASSYVKNTEIEDVQVLSSFASFSPPLWFLCLFTLYTLYLLLKAKNFLKRYKLSGAPERRNYNLLYITAHMMRLNQIRDTGLTRKVIFLCASLFSLVVVHYFCSLVKTELVTSRDPQVIGSYQDIIDRSGRPFFIRGMSYDSFFKSADAGPHRRKLWNYATSQFKEGDLYLELNPFTVMTIGLLSMVGDMVLMLGSLLMPSVPTSLCHMAARDPKKMKQLLSGGLDDLMQVAGLNSGQREFIAGFESKISNLNFDALPMNMLISVDPNEKGHLLGILLTGHMSDALRVGLHKSLRIRIETGMNHYASKLIHPLNLLGADEIIVERLLGKKIESRLHLAQDCASGRVVRPDIEYHALTLNNFSGLFILMGALFLLCFFVLLIECKL